MRYVVKWTKDSVPEQLTTPETTPEDALLFAAALIEIRPSEIWIETETGKAVAGYEEIIAEAPLFRVFFSAPPTPGSSENRLNSV